MKKLFLPEMLPFLIRHFEFESQMVWKAKWTGSFLNMNDWLYKYRKTKLTKTKVYSFHLQSVGYDLRILQSDAVK